MRSVLALCVCLFALPAAAQEGTGGGEYPGDPWAWPRPVISAPQAVADFELSWTRFTRYFDGGGTRHSLDEAFSGATGNASGTTLDAGMARFDGRWLAGPGLSLGVAVPFVWVDREGQFQPLIGPSSSLHADGAAIGDLVGDIDWHLPFSEGIGLGGRALLKVPSGQFQNLSSVTLPTGGGDVGIGGEVRLVARSPGAELGGAIGMMALLPFHADGHDVSRGDPFWLAAWASGRLGSTTRLGVALLSMARGADRVDQQQVTTLQNGGEPGALGPASSLLSVAPYLEFKGSRDSSVVLSVSNDALGWLFIPVPSGYALSGKNVIAPEPEITLRLVTGL